MSNRHLARTIAMQTLYEWDFNGRQTTDVVGLLKENFQQFAPDFSDQGFSEALIRGVLANRTAIDDTITKYAPEWPLEQITIVDRNVLRLGVFELMYSPDVPPKVAINEAIEVAKGFGGESSGRFVNGVLGAIFRDLQAQGKVPSQPVANAANPPSHEPA